MFEACGYVMLSYDLKNKLEISQYKQIIVIIWEAFPDSPFSVPQQNKFTWNCG